MKAKAKEVLKSLIIALLLVSMLFMAVRIIALENTGDGSGTVDRSASSLLSGLGLDFLAGLFKGGADSALTDFDPFSLLYPEYAAVSSNGSCRMTVTKKDTLAVFSALSDVICGALASETTVYEGNFSKLCHSNGVLFAFADNVTGDIFCRLFGDEGTRVSNPDVVFKFAFVNSLGVYFNADGKTYFCLYENPRWQTAAEGVLLVGATYSDDIFSGSVGVYPSKGTSLQGITPSRSVYNKKNQLYSAVAVNAIVSHFGFNYSSPNRSTDSSGTLTYTSNTASISFSPDSRLRFYSTQTGGGIALSDYVSGTTETGFSQKAVCAAAKLFLEGLSDYVGEMRLSSVAYSAAKSEYIITMDFVHQGFPVLLEDGGHAATFTYKNGYFTEISVSLTKFTDTNSEYDMGLPADFFEILRGRDIRFFEITYTAKGNSFYPEYRYKA